MSTSMTDLDELERLAKWATPGPWAVREDGFAVVSEACWVAGTDHRSARGLGEQTSKADAAYVAAANPQAVLALIERLRIAESELKLAQALLAESKADVQPLADRIRELEAANRELRQLNVNGINLAKWKDLNRKAEDEEASAADSRLQMRVAQSDVALLAERLRIAEGTRDRAQAEAAVMAGRKVEAQHKGTARLTLDQLLNIQRALQRAQHLCEESAGASNGEDTPVYTRDLEALGTALDAIGEVCITDAGWLFAAIKEAKGE